jgi:hypothetical protein
MKDVAKNVGTELRRKISPKQAQLAVWYLQTLRGLLPSNWKNQLTPQLLLEFLKEQKWTIGKLNRKLGDVEELDSLAHDLKAFLRT